MTAKKYSWGDAGFNSVAKGKYLTKNKNKLFELSLQDCSTYQLATKGQRMLCSVAKSLELLRQLIYI